MAQNFIACDREQELLLPPSLREWLPEGHLAWFVIDAVAQWDLAGFYGAYRADGHGRAAHDPAMMVALLLYCYAIGERSSRRIERRCVEDVACRVICANRAPDHTTIARFRQRHEVALAELFGEVLALCAEAGLAQVGVIAIDGTKVHANASDAEDPVPSGHPIRPRRSRCRESWRVGWKVAAARASGRALAHRTVARRAAGRCAGARGARRSWSCGCCAARAWTRWPARPGRRLARSAGGVRSSSPPAVRASRAGRGRWRTVSSPTRSARSASSRSTTTSCAA